MWKSCRIPTACARSRRNLDAAFWSTLVNVKQLICCISTGYNITSHLSLKCYVLNVVLFFREEHWPRSGELHPWCGRLGQIWQQTEVGFIKGGLETRCFTTSQFPVSVSCGFCNYPAPSGDQQQILSLLTPMGDVNVSTDYGQFFRPIVTKVNIGLFFHLLIFHFSFTLLKTCLGLSNTCEIWYRSPLVVLNHLLSLVEVRAATPTKECIPSHIIGAACNGPSCQSSRASLASYASLQISQERQKLLLSTWPCEMYGCN